MPGAVVLSQTRQAEPTGASEGPPPGLLDTLAAGFGAARADTTGMAQQQQLDAYKPIIDELGKLGYEWTNFVNTGTGTVSPEGVWRAMEAERAKGRGFSSLPKTREEFEQQWRERERARIAALERTASRGNAAAAFVGGVGGAMTDPINLYTLPLGGGGKTIATRMLSEAVINMGVEAAMLPTVQAQRRDLGRDEMTGGDVVQSILFAGAGAAALRGGADIIGDNWATIKAAPKAVQEKAWAAILDKSPALREKVGAQVNWEALDGYLPDVAEAMIAPEAMTKAERGAIDMLRREAAIEQGNPFVPDGAGTKAHYELLADALQGIINDSPAYVPKVRPTPAATLRTGTSVASGVTPAQGTGGAFNMGQYLQRNQRAESGGNDAAQAETSSAYGRYQFLKETWVSFYKQTFGETGETRAQILRKRADGATQDKVMVTFTNANRRSIERAGFVADDGNTYLAHFLGTGDALKVLRANPDAPVRGLVTQASIDANPAVFRNITSTSELIAWAKRKMGGKGQGVPARGGAATDDAGDDVMAALDQQLADTQADIARLETELGATAGSVDGALDGMDAPAVDAPRSPLPDAPAPSPIDPPARSSVEVAGLTPEARAAIPALRKIVDEERGVSLNRPAELSARLGLDEKNLQAALQQMAIDGLVARSSKGNFVRLPRRKDGPEDLWQFIASRGGLSPKGFSQDLIAKLPFMENPPKGHDLATIFQVERTVRWKKRPDAEGRGGVPVKEPFRTGRPMLVPGYGPLVRQSGRGLEEIGEAFWEAGWFGPSDVVPRPTEREILDFLQESFRKGGKVYHPGDAATVEAASRAADVPSRDNPFRSEFQSDEHFEYEFRQFDAVAGEIGIALDEEAFAGAYRQLQDAGDGDIAGAVLRHVQREIEDVQAMELADRGLFGDEADAGDIIEEWEAALRADGLAGNGEIPAGRFDPADPGTDGAPWAYAAAAEDTGPIEPASWAHWDEPDGPAVQQAADSMEHDARVAVQQAGLIPVARTTAPPREGVLRGQEGMMLGQGDVVQTATGRETTPVPNVAGGSDRKAANAAARMRAWLVENARLEAAARGDDFNGPMFERMDPKRLSQSDMDTLNMYLFGDEQPPVRAPLFREITADQSTAPIASDALDPNATATPMIRFLLDDGWQQKGNSFTKTFDGMAEAGMFSDGARTVTLQLDERGRFLERLDGFDTRGDIDLRDFADDPAAGLADLMGRAAPVDPAIAARQRQELNLQAQQPLRGDRKTGTAQDGVMPEGLFGGPESLAFRLDEEGDVVNPADLLAEFDADAEMLKNIKDCL